MDLVHNEIITLPAGMTLTVTADGQSSGIIRRTTPFGSSLTGYHEQPIAANGLKIIGPFDTSGCYSIEPFGKLSYSIDKLTVAYANHRLNVESFTGDLRITDEYNGKILRCDDTEDVTATVQAELPLGFNCEIIMYSTGTVTLATEDGITNITGATLLNTQYERGTLLVTKDNEFLVDGDFSIPAP